MPVFFKGIAAIFVVLAVTLNVALATESFVIEDIRVEGLNREGLLFWERLGFVERARILER